MNEVKNITKKDMRFFQNDLLTDLKKLEIQISSKVSNMNQLLLSKTSEYDSKFTKIFENMTELIAQIAERKYDNERVEQLLSLKNRFSEQLTENQTRISLTEKNLEDALFKYDKIVLENLQLPGIIGIGCKFKNCRVFFEKVYNELKNNEKYKEQAQVEIASFSDKVDNRIDKMENELNKIHQSINQICQAKFEKFFAKMEQRLQDTENIMLSSKIENSKYAEDLIKASTSLKIQWEKLENIKNEIYAKFYEELDTFKKLVDYTNRNYYKQDNEFKIFKERFTQLADYLKDFGNQKNKDFKEMKNKLDFSKKQKLENDDVSNYEKIGDDVRAYVKSPSPIRDRKKYTLNENSSKRSSRRGSFISISSSKKEETLKNVNPPKPRRNSMFNNNKNANLILEANKNKEKRMTNFNIKSNFKAKTRNLMTVKKDSKKKQKFTTELGTKTEQRKGDGKKKNFLKIIKKKKTIVTENNIDLNFDSKKKFENIKEQNNSSKESQEEEELSIESESSKLTITSNIISLHSTEQNQDKKESSKSIEKIIDIRKLYEEKLKEDNNNILAKYDNIEDKKEKIIEKEKENNSLNINTIEKEIKEEKEKDKEEKDNEEKDNEEYNKEDEFNREEFLKKYIGIEKEDIKEKKDIKEKNQKLEIKEKKTKDKENIEVLKENNIKKQINGNKTNLEEKNINLEKFNNKQKIAEVQSINIKETLDINEKINNDEKINSKEKINKQNKEKVITNLKNDSKIKEKNNNNEKINSKDKINKQNNEKLKEDKTFNRITKLNDNKGKNENNIKIRKTNSSIVNSSLDIFNTKNTIDSQIKETPKKENQNSRINLNKNGINQNNESISSEKIVPLINSQKQFPVLEIKEEQKRNSVFINNNKTSNDEQKKEIIKYQSISFLEQKKKIQLTESNKINNKNNIKKENIGLNTEVTFPKIKTISEFNSNNKNSFKKIENLQQQSNTINRTVVQLGFGRTISQSLKKTQINFNNINKINKSNSKEENLLNRKPLMPINNNINNANNLNQDKEVKKSNNLFNLLDEAKKEIKKMSNNNENINNNAFLTSLNNINNNNYNYYYNNNSDNSNTINILNKNKNNDEKIGKFKNQIDFININIKSINIKINVLEDRYKEILNQLNNIYKIVSSHYYHHRRKTTRHSNNKEKTLTINLRDKKFMNKISELYNYNELNLKIPNNEYNSTLKKIEPFLIKKFKNKQ